MTLSIVVPMYNVEAFIERCLRSIIDQVDVSRDDYEIIAVNDGSPDGSLAIAERVLADVPNSSIISQENRGLGGARNTGLRAAKGEYVWYIDSDDWIDDNAVSVLLSYIRSNPGADMFTICRRLDVDGSISNVQLKGKTGKEQLCARAYSTCAPLAVYRQRWLLENDLLFVENLFHEDNEFTPRALYLCNKLVVTNEVLYTIYTNPGSITRSRNAKKSYDLLRVVSNLYDFMNNRVVEPEVKRAFAKAMSVNLNSAMLNILQFDKEERLKFIEQMAKISHTHGVLWLSRIPKNMVEYALFRLFPRRYVAIYRMMKRFDPKYYK